MYKQEEDERILKTLKHLKPRFDTWFSYFNSTLANQASNLQGTYMWMDVYPGGSLSSGLDDFPRGYRET